ncbi:hypothetical protein [Burkholderia guangdongensis]|uniref:hypothetical protein n=1 Tax=Burkholderia guangdongensis TaxID=1792500 RepID=UPI001FE67272|nr:hypothetical protein [Burkholderia guangdongensis]
MTSHFTTHHHPSDASIAAFSPALTDLNILSEDELGAIAGGQWNWGGMILGGLRGSVIGGVSTAAGAAASGQPIGSAGIGGMVTGAIAGAWTGGLQRNANR